VVAVPRQETAANLAAEAWAQALLVDGGTHLFLAAVGDDPESPDGLGGQTGPTEAEPGLAMAHPTTDMGALKTATKTRLQMRITRQDFRHLLLASRTQGGTACFYFPQFPRNAGLEPAWDSGEARARRKAIGTILCTHICREFFSLSSGIAASGTHEP
jgi:hypothetical protein